MGLWMSRLLSWFGDKEARILVLGLDNAGKTTILCEWQRERGAVLLLCAWECAIRLHRCVCKHAFVHTD